MKKILLGLHGGATAEGAVHIARQLASRTGASIEAVAVLQPPAVVDYGYGPLYVPDPGTEAELEEQLRVDAMNQLARCDLAGTKLSVLEGQRTSSILETVAACGGDLIVVGIGPHEFADRALGGETALHLAQRSSTPVLAVPSGMRSLPRHILVAVDYSPSSLAAAQLAASLLTAGDTLELAHVTAATYIGSVALGPAPRAEAEHRMQEFADRLHVPASVRLLSRVFGGEPARTLLEVAARTKVDAIALGSHGYNFWQRVLLGSVSAKVLRLAACAVLIYPSRCVVAHRQTERVREAARATS
jgi:nucleotide-binding universal stress UspA family protein